MVDTLATTATPATLTDMAAYQAAVTAYRRAEGAGDVPLVVLFQADADSKHSPWSPAWEEDPDRYTLLLDDEYVSQVPIMCEDEDTGKRANLIGSILDPRQLSPEERTRLMAFLDRPARELRKSGEQDELNALLGRTLRWTVPGIDLDFQDRELCERARVAIDAAFRAKGLELRWAYSGSPERPRYHADLGPCLPGAEHTHLHWAILGIATHVIKHVVGMVAIKSEFYTWPGEDPAKGFVDLSNLNRSPEGRGGMFRPMGGLHKDGVHRKARVPGSPQYGTPITRELVELGLRRYDEHLRSQGKASMSEQDRCAHTPRVRSAFAQAMDEELKSEDCVYRRTATVLRRHVSANPVARHALRLCLGRLLHEQLCMSKKQIRFVIHHAYVKDPSSTLRVVERDIEALVAGGGKKVGGKSKILRDVPNGAPFLLELAQAVIADRREAGTVGTLTLGALLRRLFPSRVKGGASQLQRLAEGYCADGRCDEDHRYRSHLQELQSCGVYHRKRCETHQEGPFTSFPCDRITCMACAIHYGDMLAATVKQLWRHHKRFVWITSPEFGTRDELWRWKEEHDMATELGLRWFVTCRGAGRFVIHLVTHDDMSQIETMIDDHYPSLRRDSESIDTVDLTTTVERVHGAYLSSRATAHGLFFTSFDLWVQHMDQVAKKPTTGSPRKQNCIRAVLPWPNAKAMAEEYRNQRQAERPEEEVCGRGCEEAKRVKYELWDPVSGSLVATRRYRPTPKQTAETLRAYGRLWPSQREAVRARLDTIGYKPPAEFLDAQAGRQHLDRARERSTP